MKARDQAGAVSSCPPTTACVSSASTSDSIHAVSVVPGFCVSNVAATACVSSASTSDYIHAVSGVPGFCVSNVADVPNTPGSILASGTIANHTLNTDRSSNSSLVGSVGKHLL